MIATWHSSLSRSGNTSENVIWCILNTSLPETPKTSLTAQAASTSSKAHSYFFFPRNGKALTPLCSKGRKGQPRKSGAWLICLLLTWTQHVWLCLVLEDSGLCGWESICAPVQEPRVSQTPKFTLNLRAHPEPQSETAPQHSSIPGIPGIPVLARCCSSQLSRMIQHSTSEGMRRCCQSLQSLDVSTLESYSGLPASFQPAHIHHHLLSLAISAWSCFKTQSYRGACLLLGLGGSAVTVQASQ